MLVKILSKLTEREIESWQKLWDENSKAHFFNSPSYFLAFSDAFGFDGVVAFCYQQDELVAVLPLIQSKKAGINVWVCPDRPQRFLDRSALLLKKQDSVLFQEVADAVGEKMGNLFLADVEEIFFENFSGDKRGFFEFETVCPRTVVCKDPLDQIKPKQKREVRRRMRKYGNNLAFSLKIKPNKADLLQMQAIEKLSHKHEKKISLFEGKDAGKIYGSFMKNFPEQCLVGYLSEHDRVIAHAFGFVYKKTFLCTHMAFDKKYSNMGLGKIIIFNLLKELCALEFCIFDFSKGDSQVKRELMSRFPMQYNFYFSKNIFVMSWWKVVVKTRNVLRKAKRKFN